MGAIRVFATMTVNVKGLNSLIKSMPGIASKSAARVASSVVAEAKERSRIRTGKMRRGWRKKKTGSGYIVFDDVPWTVYNEFGTRHMAAQPMLTPAMRHAASKLSRELKALFLLGVTKFITDEGDTLDERDL